MKHLFCPIAIIFILGCASQESKKLSEKETQAFMDTSMAEVERIADSAKRMIDSAAGIIPAPDQSSSSTKSNWTYEDRKDEMTDKPWYTASITSENHVNFDFPYEGGSFLRMTIRKMKGSYDVMLSISKGQFSGSYNSPSVAIRFDDAPAKRYGFDEPADNSSDLIFLHSASSIIKQLKKAKKVKIQAPFYQGGEPVFEFNTEGLVWEH